MSFIMVIACDSPCMGEGDEPEPAGEAAMGMVGRSGRVG